MEKLKHTPGPWKTKGDGVIYVGIKTNDYKYNSSLKLGSGWHEDKWCDEDADEETLANARLIAAAPEMLEELINFCRYNCSGCSGMTKGCSGTCGSNVKTLLEKITGLTIKKILSE